MFVRRHAAIPAHLRTLASRKRRAGKAAEKGARKGKQAKTYGWIRILPGFHNPERVAVPRSIFAG